jgi:chemotaxis receptor (MCP) glutamine deamidase CheD
MRAVTIHIGDVYASTSPCLVRTILGSCISVCLYDAHARVGGMNHFLLPAAGGDAGLPTRYGVHAMEVLINALMRRGAERARLRAKVFGGASVLALSRAVPNVAEENTRFVNRFLATEGIAVTSRCLGGSRPLQVRFETHTGRAYVRAVGATRADALAEREQRFRTAVLHEMTADAATRVTLF